MNRKERRHPTVYCNNPDCLNAVSVKGKYCLDCQTVLNEIRWGARSLFWSEEADAV